MGTVHPITERTPTPTSAYVRQTRGLGGWPRYTLVTMDTDGRVSTRPLTVGDFSDLMGEGVPVHRAGAHAG